MTDPHAPLDDEDLSAVIDGEATADVVARAERDPRAQARMAELTRAAEALRADAAPLDAATVDRLVAGALAAADAPEPGGDAHGSTTPIAPVAPLPTRRGRVVPPWLVAAAVAVLAGIGLTLVVLGRGDTGEETATDTAALEQGDDRSAGADRGAPEDAPAAESAEDDAGAGDSPALSERGAEADGAAAEPAPVVELGAYPSADGLRTALRDAFPAGEPVASDELSTANVDRCAEQLGILLDQDDPPRHTGQAVVDGELLVVFEFDTTSLVDEEPTQLVTAAQPATCNPVVTFER